MKLHNQPIPFVLADGIALLPGKIEETAGHFALDTGATQTVLNRTYCAAGAAEAEAAITFDGGTQDSALARGAGTRLTVAGEAWDVDEPLILDMTYVEAPLRKAKPDLIFLGSLGADFLGEGLLVMDYVNRQAVLRADAVPEGMRELPLTVEKLPVAELTIQGRPYLFVLDTGANHFVMDRAAAPMDFICASDDADAPHRIPSLTFAGTEYRNLTGLVTDLSAVRDALQVDGIIGYQLLKDHLCCLDTRDSGSI